MDGKRKRLLMLAMVVLGLTLMSNFVPWAGLAGDGSLTLDANVPSLFVLNETYSDDIDIETYSWGFKAYPPISYVTEKNGYLSDSDSFSALDLNRADESEALAEVLGVESTTGMMVGAALLLLVLPLLCAGALATIIASLAPKRAERMLGHAFLAYLTATLFYILGLYLFLSPAFGDHGVILSFSYSSYTVQAIIGLSNVGLSYKPGIIFPIILTALAYLPFDDRTAGALGVPRYRLFLFKRGSN